MKIPTTVNGIDPKELQQILEGMIRALHNSSNSKTAFLAINLMLIIMCNSMLPDEITSNTRDDLLRKGVKAVTDDTTKALDNFLDARQPIPRFVWNRFDVLSEIKEASGAPGQAN